jgi:hypothetical protein
LGHQQGLLYLVFAKQAQPMDLLQVDCGPLAAQPEGPESAQQFTGKCSGEPSHILFSAQAEDARQDIAHEVKAQKH